MTGEPKESVNLCSVWVLERFLGMDKKRQIQILQIIKSNNERENLVKGLALETPNRAQVCQQGHGVVRCHKTWGTLIQV